MPLLKRFNTELLQPGDILFYKVTKKSRFIARLIAFFEKLLERSFKHSSYSHVSIVDYDTDYILESRWPISQKTKLDWNYLNSHYKIEVYRVNNITDGEIDTALLWCYKHLGIKYDIGLFFFGLFPSRKLEVCTSFVIRGFLAARIMLIPNRNKTMLITPNCLLRNMKGLKRIFLI